MAKSLAEGLPLGLAEGLPLRIAESALLSIKIPEKQLTGILSDFI